MLFNSFIISAANYGSLSNTILSGNLYNFYMLFLNNLTSPSTDVPSVVVTKYVIFNSLLQTIRITSFPATSSNFVIKSTIRCIYSFSGISLNFSFSAGTSILFFICWHILHLSIYFFIFLVISSRQ